MEPSNQNPVVHTASEPPPAPTGVRGAQRVLREAEANLREFERELAELKKRRKVRQVIVPSFAVGPGGQLVFSGQIISDVDE